MKQPFSICIITKNEAEKLKKCLQAASRLQAEIVVADTGSTDHTMDIIKQYADKYGTFTWCDHFAKAKNYVAGLASNDWILTLDTDEYVTDYHLDEINDLITNHPTATGSIRRKNHFLQDGEQRIAYTWTARLYNRKLYEYQGRIHEQLCWIGAAPAAKEPSIDLYVNIDHDSYEHTEDGMQKKAKRNKRLLLMDLEEYGDQPYTLFQLGKSCYTLKEYEQAVDYLSRGLEFDLNPNLEYVIDMVETYGYALINAGKAAVALGLESVYDAFGHHAEFVFLMGLVYMNNGLLEQAIQQFLKATTLPSENTKGTNSYLAYYNIGVIFECCGNPIEAAEYYKKCGNYSKAKDRLRAL